MSIIYQLTPSLAWDVIYTSRAYAMIPVRLSVTFVHCGHRVRWIPDIFACLDRWMSLLLTDNAWPGSSDGMMPGFLVEEGGGYGKSGNCSDIAYFTYVFLMDRNHMTCRLHCASVHWSWFSNILLAGVTQPIRSCQTPLEKPAPYDGSLGKTHAHNVVGSRFELLKIAHSRWHYYLHYVKVHPNAYQIHHQHLVNCVIYRVFAHKTRRFWYVNKHYVTQQCL